jgi:hypothetical protein
MVSLSPLPLLDPKNDYVFKRLFGESPELLVALTNDLHPSRRARRMNRTPRLRSPVGSRRG